MPTSWSMSSMTTRRSANRWRFCCARAIEVRTYESAAAFLSALPGLTPGCIITDVRMPEMSGIDLLRRLKELASPRR